MECMQNGDGQLGTVALVTGANQGLGLQLVRELCRRGITTILSSRDEERGMEAVRLLQSEGLGPKLLAYHQLDVSVPESVERIVEWLSKHFGGLDILVNNAGISSVPGASMIAYGSRVEAAKAVLATNYYGTKRMIQEMVPVMKSGGRIVNISSKCGDLDVSSLKNEWRTRLDDIPNLTVDTIEACLHEFVQSVEKGEITKGGWPLVEASFSGNVEDVADYCMSKMAINAYSQLVAQELSAQDKKISLNCVCPGLTSTALTCCIGHSVEVGADTAVWLALLPASELPSGKFFTGRKDVGFSGMPFFFNGELSDFQSVVEKLQVMNAANR